MLGDYVKKTRVDLVKSHLSSNNCKGAEWNLDYPVTGQKILIVLEGFKLEGH